MERLKKPYPIRLASLDASRWGRRKERCSRQLTRRLGNNNMGYNIEYKHHQWEERLRLALNMSPPLKIPVRNSLHSQTPSCVGGTIVHRQWEEKLRLACNMFPRPKG